MLARAAERRLGGARAGVRCGSSEIGSRPRVERRMTGKLRVALVVQRYGEEVNGGSETLARRIAELIADEVDLTVLTTCALDYLTWANAFPAGQTDVNGVRVLRFPVRQPRDAQAFEHASSPPMRAPKTRYSDEPGCRPRGRTRPSSWITWLPMARAMTQSLS